MAEIRRLEEFPHYFVSDDGQVFCDKKGTLITVQASLTGGHDKITSKGINLAIKYLYVHLNRKTFAVHHLVAKAFLPPKPFQGAILRHLDGCSTNNCKENLMWGTGHDDAEDRRKCGTINTGTKCGHAKLTEEQAREIQNSVYTWGEQAKEAKRLGISVGAFSQVKNGTTWKHLKEK